MFGGLIRRVLVTELTIGEPGEQLSLNDRDVTDDRRRAVQHVPHRAESSGRIAVREADHRAGIADLARSGLLISERRELGAGLTGHPDAGLGGQRPASHLTGQSERAHQLRLQAPGCAELLKRLLMAPAAGLEHPGHQM